MKTRYEILIGIVVLLIVIRLILPHVVVHFANDKLAHLPGYYGHVKGIHLSLFRGACTLNGVYLDKVDSLSKKQTEFFKTGTIELSLEWGALFHRSIVGKLALNSPSFVLTKDKVGPKKIKKDTTDFPKLLKGFMPVRINRFEINNGAFHFIDSTSKPNINIAINKIHVLAINLTNVTSNKVLLPSSLTAQADVFEGNFIFHSKLNMLAENPTFEFDAELKNTNLVLLNDFFKAYGKFDISRGRFGLFTEMAAKEGGFIGYVKPVIKDLKVMGLKDTNAGVLQKSWEAVIGAVAFVFKNQRKNQLATKLPIEGKFSAPKLNIFYAIWEVLQNAYVQALTSTIDNGITMNSVKIDSSKALKLDAVDKKKKNSKSK